MKLCRFRFSGIDTICQIEYVLELKLSIRLGLFIIFMKSPVARATDSENSQFFIYFLLKLAPYATSKF
jgi:hypothetical protein